MSYTFTLNAASFLGPQSLLRAIDDRRARILDELDGVDQWLDRKCYHFYIDNFSTRGVECALEADGLTVRILSCSNAEDYELAEKLLRTAPIGDAEVQSEEDESVPLPELATIFSKSWVDAQIESGPRVVAAMVKKDRKILTVPGLLRDAHFGPRLIAELESASPSGSTADFTARFLEKLREIRYAPTGDYFVASIMSATPPGEAKAMRFAVWGEGVGYFFPNVEFLAVRAAEKDVFFIPRARLDTLLPGRLRYLDEIQCFVESITPADWPALVTKARAFDVKPKNAPTKKRWWQLWK